MIINSYTISNGRTDPEIWTVELKMYPDGLVINTGMSENFIIDYVDIPVFIKGLSEISLDNPDIVVECSQDSNCFLKFSGEDVHVLLDDDEIIASFYIKEISEIIEVLEMIVQP